MGRYGNVVTGPKKTPANTVKNSTFSTSNRFGGPPGTTTPGGPPGSGRPSQISRPAMAAAAVSRHPNYGPPGTVTPGGPPGTGSRITPAVVPRGGHRKPVENTAPVPRGGRRKPVENAGTQRAPTPTRNVGPNVNQLAPVTPGGPPGSGRPTQISRPSVPSFSQEELMRAATSGAATHPAAQAVQQPSPAPTPMPRVVPGPSPTQLAEGSQGAQEVTRNQGYTDQQVHDWLGTEGAQNLLAQNAANAAAAAAPAWDPANNDPAITGPVGMWTDPNNGGQMPDPADADAWQAMQDAVDKEFGPGQSIYNPEYDIERFPTYDPSNTIAPWQGTSLSGGLNAPTTMGGDYGDYGSGPGADLGTYNPNEGEYLQFGLDLAQNTSDYGRVGEGREFWNQAQQRKWDEANRGIPGMFNSRGMIDSGLLTRAEGLSASDQRFETDVRQYMDNEERARLERERMNMYGGFEGGLTQGLVNDYLGGALTQGMGTEEGYMRSGIMNRAIPTWGSGVGR